MVRNLEWYALVIYPGVTGRRDAEGRPSAIRDLFVQFESAPVEARGTLALTAIHRLQLHADLEHKVIYPAIRGAIDRPGLIEQAMKEHRLAKRTIRKLMRLRPGDDTFRAMFCALGEQIQYHMDAEEREILPRAERSDLDWQTLEARGLGYAKSIEDKRRSRGAQKSSRSKNATAGWHCEQVRRDRDPATLQKFRCLHIFD